MTLAGSDRYCEADTVLVIQVRSVGNNKIYSRAPVRVPERRYIGSKELQGSCFAAVDWPAGN